jgi:GntR family transcriptional regulator, rspAB operon transcriptional repressor
MREGDRVYAVLRDEILEWKLSPGTVLGEVELSKKLGVSRTPVREALRHLEREKLVQIRPGRGAVVSEISMHNIAQIFQMREALETYAARLAARKGDRDVFGPLLEELTSAWKNLGLSHVPADGYADYTRLISRLDSAIEVAADNVYLSDALASVSAHVARLRHLARRDPERMHKAAEEHVSICQAILDNDPERAAELTAAHIHNSLRGILTVFIEDVTGSTLMVSGPR